MAANIELGDYGGNWWWRIYVERPDVTITGGKETYKSRLTAVRAARRVATRFGVSVTGVCGVDDPENDAYGP